MWHLELLAQYRTNLPTPTPHPAAVPLPAAITLGAALPVALFVKSPRLLSSVSQASVAFIFFFSLMIAGMAFSQAPGKQA